MKLKNTILVILFVILLTVKLNAQTTSLFCTHNSISLGSYAYSNCDLINDTITDNTGLPALITSTNMSSTVDSSNHIYYCKSSA